MFKNYSYLNNDFYDCKYAKYDNHNIIENFINNSQENTDLKYFEIENGEGEVKFESIEARYIKIVIFDWNENISGKFDVFINRELQNTLENKRDYSSILNNDSIGTGNAQSKLDSENGWTSANNNIGEWVSIDLDEIKKITGIKISKKKDSNNYIKKFAVHYSSDNEKYSYVRLESGSNARKYKFLFNGCPTNVDRLEKIGEDEETFDTCALKCNQNSQCHHFEITGCSGDDFNPKCKGTCHIYGAGIAENNNCDSSGNVKSFYKLKYELTNNEVLNVDDYLVSPNGKLFLVMRNTGNLVLYNQFNFISENILWKSTEEKEVGDYYCKMMEDGILIIFKRSETEVEDEKIWETEIIKEEEEFTLINLGNCSSDDNCNPPKVIDLPDEIKFVENIPYTSEGVKIDTYSFNVDTNLETKKISVKRSDQENAGWSEDIYLKGFKTEPENKEETEEEIKEGEPLRYNTPFNIQVKTYPGDKIIKLLKFIKADNTESNQIIKYNDKVHIVKADNPYEIGYFPVTGDGSRKLAFKNIISNDELINYSFYIKQKLDSEGNKKFNDGDNIKFNHEISISIQNINLTGNCGWWGCRVMKPSGYFSHGGTEIESIPLFRINEKPKENIYNLKVQDDGNIVLSEKIGAGIDKLWESYTNYKFAFNGFPNNLTTLETSNDESYITCKKKCSENASCSAFLIEECNDNNNYPLCTGKCTLYSGYSNPENGNDNEDDKTQKTYKKITAFSQITDISLDATTEAATEAVDNAKKTFTNLTGNLFGSSEEESKDDNKTTDENKEGTEENKEDTENKEDSEDTLNNLKTNLFGSEEQVESEENNNSDNDKTEDSGSGISNNIILIIILVVIGYLLYKRYYN